MKNNNRKLFSLFDIIIIAVVVVVSVISFLSQFNTDTSFTTCVVRKNGEVIYTQSLYGIDYFEYNVSGEYPLCVVMSESYVYVKSPSCPDKLCEHTGKISKPNQSVVCLPAKVSITLEKSDTEVDAVVG